MISISCSLGRPSPGSGDALPGCASTRLNSSGIEVAAEEGRAE
jgi:hypothetical protein